MTGVVLFVDGQPIRLRGRVETIVALLVANQEQVNAPPAATVELHCSPERVQLKIHATVAVASLGE